MCRLHQVSPSGYYARQHRPPSCRAQANQRLCATIRMIHTNSDGVYASHKIWRVLHRQGGRCGKHRVARLMQGSGLRDIPAPTLEAAGERSAGEDHQPVSAGFTALAPNAKGVTDISYIPTREG